MKLFIFLTLLIFVGCSTSDDCFIENECLDKLLIENEMVPYVGTEPACHTLQMVECGDKDYFFIDCCVCDMVFDPFDCNGRYLLRENYEKNAAFSSVSQNEFNATYLNCKEPRIVGYLK